jgi:hypothetical protein
MEICIFIRGQEHCFDIPIFEVPIPVYHPGPGPINYPALLRDAVVVASLQAATQHVQDDGVREALRTGISSAVDALQSRAGDDVRIREGATAD